MLPLIFGTGPRRDDLGGGTFYCPNCDTERNYTHQRVRNYFRLYFIPVLPLGEGQEIVQCEFCGQAYNADVLTLSPPPKKRKVRPLAVQLNSLEERLRDGAPVEYVIAELTAAGLDRELAGDNVRRAIGDERIECPACGLTYALGVAVCAEDGTSLSPQ